MSRLLLSFSSCSFKTGDAESFLGKIINKLVKTVPANFNYAQRNCAKQMQI